ncbi:restriction endonuclease subunit R, partial [bacterium]|nr:restriction endonuclease subunit R [bacterium]
MTDLDLIKFLIEKTENELSIIEKGIADLKKREQSQQEYLRKLHKQKRSALEDTDYPELSDAVVNKFSSETEKIKLFRSLFRGREDVFPRRFESKRTGRKGYQPVCKNEWIEGICMKPGIKCADCSNRDYIPITDNAIRSHLSGKDHITYRYGDFVMGVYPLLKDDTCYFLAIDFDKSTWKDDVRSYLETCETFNVPASLERSRSGNGGHIWIFFPKPVPAVLARKMGSFMLTQSMELRPEIGLDSYDRLFPNQDTMPKGGFGNLIALPLQKIPRIMGNSVFVDSNFDPYPDQWAYLSNLRKMLPVEVEKIVEEGVHQGKILGVRAVITDDKDENPWTAPPSGRVFQERIEGKLPIVVDIVLGNQIYINKTELPPGLRNQLIRIASFQNPEFYRAQARRQSIYNKPRIISCAEDFTKHIGLPRGCLTDVQDVFTSLGIKINLIDERYSGVPVDIAFQGDLTAEQEKAADICMK